jgi:hypothetical protein
MSENRNNSNSLVTLSDIKVIKQKTTF